MSLGEGFSIWKHVTVMKALPQTRLGADSDPQRALPSSTPSPAKKQEQPRGAAASNPAPKGCQDPGSEWDAPQAAASVSAVAGRSSPPFSPAALQLQDGLGGTSSL